MAEINSFPIQTKSYADLDQISAQSTSYLDSLLVYDESTETWRSQTLNEHRKVSAFIYPTVDSLKSADLAYDIDMPVYVRVEEMSYRLYKIINAVPGTEDILLDNGNVAQLQGENPVYFDTAGILSSSSLPNGAVAYTKGVFEIGDGGSGKYIVEPAIGTPDGFYRMLLNGGNHAVLQPPFYFKQFGAIADYNSTTMTGTDNSTALARAVAAIPLQDLNFGRGDFGIGPATPIVLNNPTKWIGVKRRFATRLFAIGTGPKVVRTQYTHPDDGTDPPISALISIESPDVHFQDIYFSNAFNGTLPAGNFGSDWDVLIFVKSQPFFTMTRCRTDGYPRVAGIYYDVTRNNGNCDGSTLHDCWFQGFWGCKVQGPNPKSGETEILPGDTRGGGGFSDFTMSGSTRFFDMNHHSGVRASDTDGGAFYIDGHLNTPAKAIQGHKFIGTRFTSWSPWLIYIGRSSRDLFDNAHFERTTGRFKVDGVTPAGNADVLIELSSECRYSTWCNGTIHYNCTFVNNSTQFSRDSTCIEGTSFGQNFLPAVINNSGAGTYIPVVSSSVGGDLPGASYTYSARYTQDINGTVKCQGRIVLSSKAGLSGNISIKNLLPFPNQNIVNGHLAERMHTFNVGFSAGNDVQVLVGPNGTTGDLYQHAATGTGRITDAELANNSILHFNFTYIKE